MSGIVDTMDSGMVPEVPSNEGETLPARGSRVRHMRTSAYICVRLGDQLNSASAPEAAHPQEEVTRSSWKVAALGGLVELVLGPFSALQRSKRQLKAWKRRDMGYPHV